MYEKNKYRCVDRYCGKNERDLIRVPQKPLNLNKFDGLTMITNPAKLGVNDLTAEFICIMLGDGHLDKNGYNISIALNLVDEPQYIEYVYGQILQKLFPDVHIGREEISKDGGKGFAFRISRKKINNNIAIIGRGINKKGLVRGNKVENQVDVPDWIFPDYSSLSFVKKGLKGLFDTDGSFTVHSGLLNIEFTSRSIPLSYDFYNMCLKLNISPQPPRFTGENNSCKIEIFSSVQINKFIDVVDPEKFKEKIRRFWLGLNIIYQKAPDKIKNDIIRKIQRWKEKNSRKLFNYGAENTEFLKKWIEEIFLMHSIRKLYNFDFLGQITEDMMEFAIFTARIEWRDVQFLMDKKFKIYFPRDLLFLIIDFLYETLIRRNDYDDIELVDKIHDFLSSENLIGKINPFHLEQYRVILDDYYLSIVLLVREVIRRIGDINLRGNISYWYILKYFKNIEIQLSFGRQTTDLIIDNIKKKYGILSDDVFKYSKVVRNLTLEIFNLINEKGHNEFSIRELSMRIPLAMNTIRQHFNEQLLPLNIVYIIRESTNNRPKIFSLTELGFNIANRLLM